MVTFQNKQILLTRLRIFKSKDSGCFSRQHLKTHPTLWLSLNILLFFFCLRLGFIFSSLPSYITLSSPFSISNVRQYAVDEQGHDSSTEEACYRDGHKPGQEDVPEETPVHSLLGADPAHCHH